MGEEVILFSQKALPKVLFEPPPGYTTAWS